MAADDVKLQDSLQRLFQELYALSMTSFVLVLSCPRRFYAYPMG